MGTNRRTAIPTSGVFGRVQDERVHIPRDAKAMIDGIVSSGAERTEHMFDSPLRFLDWLTLGVISANQNRGEVLLDEPNLYNAVNWLTMGAADTVSGAIAPEEPLSLQHWMDSYATVMLGYGAWKSGKAADGTKVVTDVEKNEYTVVNVSTAEEANTWQKTQKNYKNPPYKPNTEVLHIKLTSKTKFVRVYDGDKSKMYGGWIMKADEIQGLTPTQIREKFALPHIPKYICDVELPAGTELRMGIVNEMLGWGSGGGIQYDLMGQFVGEFKNQRILK